jgi:Cys-rich protein (TIGR04453 family)
MIGYKYAQPGNLNRPGEERSPIKRLMIGMAMSATLVLGSTMLGCGNECDKECDRYVKCVTDMSGGKLKKAGDKMKKGCLKACKKDQKKAQKMIRKMCGK